MGVWGDITHKLYWHLYNREYYAEYLMDKNRIADALDLRIHWDPEAYKYLDARPVSILEVIVALAKRCEEQIMCDPDYGDRTVQWINHMIASLELNGQFDDIYDEEYVDDVIDRFLSHEYSPDGHGSLFWVPNCSVDMREKELWVQQSYFLNSILF